MVETYPVRPTALTAGRADATFFAVEGPDMAFRFLSVFRTVLATLLFALVMNGASLSLPAQTNEGQMAGNVLDSSGAAIPEATISARNEGTGSVYKVVSTSAGSYRFPSVALGRYTVTANAATFRQSVSTGVEVQVNTVASLNITLLAGSASETVTVEANAPLVETESSELGGVVNSRQIVELPLALGGVGALRSPEAFVFLIPGTTGPGTGNSANGIFVSKVAGGQNFGNEILVDGASQTRSENGSSFDEEGPSVEALSEFKVTTATPSAEFGRTTGGVENFVTKSGTNQYHGTVFELFQNEAMNANAWFNNGRLAQCAPGDAGCLAVNKRPVDKKNDYGGSAGGPISIPHLYNGRDRTFGFFAWEQFRQHIGSTATSTLPTAAERGGDFSALLGTATSTINPCTGLPVLQGQIFDPATTQTIGTATCRSAFAGNIIPTARLSKAGQGLAAFIPAPNSPGLTNNFNFNATLPINDTTYSVRIDHNVSERLKLFASYNTRENNLITSGPEALPAPVDPNSFTQDFLTHFVRLGADYTLTPALLNHFNFGFNRSNSINHTFAASGGINYAQQVGIANVNTTAFPVITFDGLDQYQRLASSHNDDNIDNGWRFNDSLSFSKGRHNFRVGGDFRFQQYSPINATVAQFNFVRAQTSYSSAGGASQISGNSLASLLLGATDSASQNVPAHQPQWLSTYYAVFAQDDFKVTSHLTLNLGVRYDVDVPRHEKGNNTSNFSITAPDPAAGGHPGALVFGTTCHCNTKWADTWYKDIAPRVGFAYSPANSGGKTSIRGAYAILYGPLQYADFGGSMTTGFTANANPSSLDHFSPAFTLDSGFPAFTAPPNLDPGQLTGQPVGGEFVSASQGRPAMVENWSLQVQQQLAKDLIFTIGYIGERGTHLRSSIENINNAPLSSLALGDHLTDPQAGNTVGVTSPYTGFNGQVQQALRPFPQYAFIATDCCLQNLGQSTYHALISSIERRFSNGVNLQASYTWAKNITDADSILPGVNAGVQQFQNSFNHRAEKALSTQDIPHTFVVSYLYQLPVGRGRRFLNNNKLVDLAVGGWELGGVQRYQSGEPISFGCASGIPGQDNCIRYSRVQGQSLKSAAYQSNQKINPFGTENSVFNRAAFYDQNQPISAGNPLGRPAGGAFRFGDMPRVTGEIRNFKYLNEDFSLIKDFHFSEKSFFQLKGEFLNAFNRHIFGIPDTESANGDFGVPTYTINGPRTLQVTGRVTF